MKTPFFYQAIVIDDQDPLMLGRVRARIITEDYDAIVSTIRRDGGGQPWSSKDPFLFLPLLPYYMYQVPKVDELVLTFYGNPGTKFANQFFVQNTFFSPTSTNFQYNVGADGNMATGLRYKDAIELQNRIDDNIRSVSGNTQINSTSNGVFPRPGDNALLGRGSADVIVQQDSVLLRSGKFSEEKLVPNKLPTPNINRSFIQLSRFPKQTLSTETVKYTTKSPANVLIKYLVEYNIINPETTLSAFTGSIYLYQLKPDAKTTTDNLTIGTNLDEKLKTLIYQRNFQGLNIQGVQDLINRFLNACNSSTTFDGDVLFFPNTQKFPILYRPSEGFYRDMTNPITSTKVRENLDAIYQGVKLQTWLTQPGWNYILSENITGLPFETVEQTADKKESLNQPITYNALGGERIFLLTQKSEGIPGKNRINFDDTLYGISEEKFVNEILPNTSSAVRGEELLELINLIVRFLVTHTHAFPGLPPVQETEDGTRVNDILAELQNAVNKILNENIRIN